MEAYVGPFDHELSPEYIEARTLRMAADKRKQHRMNFICDLLNNIVAHLAFIFLFGTLAVAGCGLAYLIVGGALNILGVEVPGISSR
jgi:hypothetical protein